MKCSEKTAAALEFSEKTSVTLNNWLAWHVMCTPNSHKNLMEKLDTDNKKTNKKTNNRLNRTNKHVHHFVHYFSNYLRIMLVFRVIRTVVVRDFFKPWLNVGRFSS